MTDLPAFKAYDVRGKLPDELNEDLVYTIGLAYANEMKPQGPVATGRDIRDSSPMLQAALNRGLNDGGVDVIDAGLCGTETIYHAASLPEMGGGVMVTASHNPKGYNGIKPVGAGGAPLTGDQGLLALKTRILRGNLSKGAKKGSISSFDYLPGMCERFFRIVPPDSVAKVKLVANPGNGCAGPTAKALLDRLPVETVWVNYEPDPEFPNGIPNPLLPENRGSTARAVIESGADLGIAWDGDFDRCFFFDAGGRFIEGYYLVGCLAEAILRNDKGACIIHDPRMYWNTQAIVSELGGRCVESKTGHAYIKQVMRREDAAYGGEMSAHHYFKSFAYCDSGMLPWLMVLQVLKAHSKSMAELVEERIAMFPCSGEINFTVSDGKAVFAKVCETYKPRASQCSEVDGLSCTFDDRWRFNLRASNTEPLLRLNVESRGDQKLMEEKTAEIQALIEKSG